MVAQGDSSGHEKTAEYRTSKEIILAPNPFFWLDLKLSRWRNRCLPSRREILRMPAGMGKRPIVRAGQRVLSRQYFALMLFQVLRARYYDLRRKMTLRGH